jgi:uridine kinase
MPAFVIGIGGGSAAGKTAVARELQRLLRPLRVEVINQDRFFRTRGKLPRHVSPDGRRTWDDHNHPDSFDFPALRGAVEQAREGEAEVVIVEGILVLHDAELRGLMDVKLFVDAEADERIVRRIRRNVGWGWELDGICDFYLDSVRYRHREFCEPTRAHADVVVPGGAYEREEAERLLREVCGRVRAAVAAEAGGCCG